MKIVVIGGGFAGLAFISALRKHADANVDITLITKKGHFLFTPWLPDILTQEMRIMRAYTDMQSLRGIRLHTQEVTAIHTKEHIIRCGKKAIPYDILVIATGSMSNSSMVPGAKEHSFEFREYQHVEAIKKQLKKPTVGKAPHRTIIIGGGPAGIEVAFQILEHQRSTMRMSEIIILQRDTSILSGFPPRIIKVVEHILGTAGIRVRTGFAVQKITQGVVHGISETVIGDTIIWCAGIMASIPNMDEPLAMDDTGRIRVDKYLQAKKDLFVLGDAANTNGMNRSQPPTAQIALAHGLATGKNVARLLQKKPLREVHVSHKGYLLTLEKGRAITNLFGILIEGRALHTLRNKYYEYRFRQLTL